MPKSKARRKTQTARKSSKRAQDERQQEAAPERLSMQQFRMRRLAGWLLVGVGAVIACVHWYEHITTPIFPRLVSELGLGWPTAIVMVIGGATILSRHSYS